MGRLLAVLTLCFVLSAVRAFGTEEQELTARFRIPAEHSRLALTWVSKIKKEIQKDGLFAVAKRGDEVNDYLVNRALDEIEKSDSEYAYYARKDWDRNYQNFLEKKFFDRHIGDHPTEMLSLKIEEIADKCIFVIGLTAAKFTHVCVDLKTLNAATKITFKPCTFAMDQITIPRKDEYKNHFALDNGGENLYGEIPVITYWVVTIGTMAAGIPIPFINSAAEYAMGHWVGPRLSDAIFERVCQ